jgi:hypothetical protein
MEVPSTHEYLAVLRPKYTAQLLEAFTRGSSETWSTARRMGPAMGVSLRGGRLSSSARLRFLSRNDDIRRAACVCCMSRDGEWERVVAREAVSARVPRFLVVAPRDFASNNQPMHAHAHLQACSSRGDEEARPSPASSGPEPDGEVGPQVQGRLVVGRVGGIVQGAVANHELKVGPELGGGRVVVARVDAGADQGKVNGLLDHFQVVHD